MTVEITKTGQHLREQLLKEGDDTRMRAFHALSHGYSLGSEATIAKLLLNALGGDQAAQTQQTEELEAPRKLQLIIQPGDMVPALFGQIADPMMESANDDDHDAAGLVSVS